MAPCIWMADLVTRRADSDACALSAAAIAGGDIPFPAGDPEEQRPRADDAGEIVDRAVLERLEGAEREAELLARPEIVERHLERRIHRAQELGGNRDEQPVPERSRSPEAAVLPRDQRSGRDSVELDVAEGRAVHGPPRIDSEPLRAGLDMAEHLPVGTRCRDQHPVGHRGRGNAEARPFQHRGAFRRDGRADFAGTRDRIDGGHHEGLARDDSGKQRVGPLGRRECRGGDHRGSDRLGCQRAAGLFQQQRRLGHAEPEPAAFRRYEDADPALGRHFAQHVAVEAVSGVAQPPQPLRPTGTCEEPARAVAEHALLFGEKEVHL